MTDNETATPEVESGKQGWAGVPQKILTGVVTAVVLGALVWLGNFVSQGGLIRVLGGVTKDEAVTKDEFKAALSQLPKVSFTSVRFGQKGSSANGLDPGEPFSQLTSSPVAQHLGSIAEFPICAVTEIRVRAAEGACLVGPEFRSVGGDCVWDFRLRDYLLQARIVAVKMNMLSKNGGAPPLITGATAHVVPTLIAAAGGRASYRFFEFFTAQIRNPHTRRAYARAATEFFDWLEAKGVTKITAIESVHVATYIEQLSQARSAPTAKLRLAALRHLFDWMVIGQIMPTNPAAAVRGPRHIVRRGKTPVLDPAEARQLINAIDTTTLIGLRDRALIGLMVYSFARIGAAIGMRVEDVYTQNRRLRVRLHEKGGKQHAMPCHHNLESYLHAYIDGAGLANDPKALLFQTYSRATGRLTGNPLPQANAYAMIQRRAKAAEITTKIGNHTFRATGVTAYLKNGGTLEKAAQMANHASTRTTQLYDRRAEEVTLDEVERILV